MGSVIALSEDLHTVFVRFAVILGPGNGWIGFTCDCSRYKEVLSSSDDNAVFDREV